MLRRLDLREAHGDLRDLIPRPQAALAPPVSEVRSLLDEVRTGGDDAVRSLTARHDGVEVAELLVPRSAREEALAALPPLLREAMEAAKANIVDYHRAQVHDDARHERDGLVVREIRRAVDRAGAYVPGGGGRPPLISTVLMTVLPARVAGVPEVVLCTPPDPDGTVPAGILAAAELAGVDELYCANGPAAIGAMAYGTESLRRVDVIVGPGNVYVAQAKREVASVVGVPSSFAGPSEVVVVADDITPPELAAIDLIVQIEHGSDSVAWLITWSEEAADRIEAALVDAVGSTPRREVVEKNLQSNCYTALVASPEQAIAVANAIAPEHLELMTADPEALVPLVRHAGAVFCGFYAPASIGDYLAGPNHVLPTYGSARFAGALRVDDFCKQIHVVSLDAAAFNRLAPHVAAMAEAEGLYAHAESVRQRGPR